MVALVERLTRDGQPTREQARKAAPKPVKGRPRAYVFSFRAPSKAFNLKLRFKKSQVEADEIIQALEAILADLRNSRS